MKVFTKAFWAYAGERAVKTAAQSALSLMSVDYTGVLDVDFKAVLSAAGLAALLSVLTSLSGKSDEGKEAGAEADIALDVDYELPEADVNATQAIEVEAS